MKLLYNWLREYVDIPYGPEELVEVLENLGMEVEEYRYLGQGLRGKVVVGEILEARDHPERKGLRLIKVAVGREAVEMVTGAHGMDVGVKAVFALEGAQLPGGLVVEKREIGGFPSYGMPLSEKELGIGEKADEVLILPRNFRAGDDPLPHLGLDDWLYDLYITPNRPDLLGVIGIAFDLRAVCGGELRLPSFEVEESEEAGVPDFEIADYESCPRFTLRRMKGIKVGESPDWLRWRLYLIGQRPLNNVVDVSNYVLFETGHPTHIYDAAKIEGNLVIRRSRKGEKILSLDGVERQLPEGVPVIADSRGPQALAGIIGGEHSAVSEETREVLLESAYFRPELVRMWSQKLGVRTESSQRFERGADPGFPPEASARVAQLLLQLAGGIAGPIKDDFRELPRPTGVLLRKDYPSRLLGVDIPSEKTFGVLTGLGFKVEDRGETFYVEIPTRRRDISIEADLVEEVGRVYGYGNIPGRVESSGGFLGKKPRDLRHRVRDIVARLGFQEVQSLEFVSEREVKAFSAEEFAAKIMNPLTEQFSYVRPLLLMGLLNVASINQRRGVRDVRAFQVGKEFIYRGPDELPEEREVLCAIASGRLEKNWLEKERELDFYDIKGLLSRLLDELGCEYGIEESEIPYLDYGASVTVNGKKCGWIGRLKEEIAELYDLKFPLFAMEVEIAVLEGCEKGRVEIPRYPPVKRDISVLMDEDVPYAELERLIYKVDSPLLTGIRVIDVYRGKPLPEGKKSITVGLVFLHRERTLQDEEVDEEVEKIVEILAKEGYIIRGYEGGIRRS